MTNRLDNDDDALQENVDTLPLTQSTEFGEADIRAAYIEDLLKAGRETQAKRIAALPLHSPMSKLHKLNGDEEPILEDMNRILNDASMDLFCLDNEIINTAGKYTALIHSAIERMNLAEARVLTERQRIEDINRICSAYKNLSDVRTLTSDDFTGICGYDADTNTFSATPKNGSTKVKLSVINVEGNGYAGNKYVLHDDGSFVLKSVNTADVNALVDDSRLTTFEYSRLCGTGEKILTDLNLDDKPVTCTLSLTSDVSINALRIDVSSEKVMIRDLLISSDGNSYHSVLAKPIQLDGDIYTNPKYANGSKIIAFPLTRFVKIILESNGYYEGERLAYEKTNIGADGNSRQEIVALTNARRKVIAIDGIRGYVNGYESATIETGELISGILNEAKSIAIFANEYIPDYFKKGTYITYTLLVNGKEYAVKPINSNEEGAKLLCFREFQYKQSSIHYLDEPIKSARLRITIQAANQATSYLSALKICLGD